jgi:hypothetical protein
VTPEDVLTRRLEVKKAVEQVARTGAVQSMRIVPLVTERYLDIYHEVLKAIAEGTDDPQTLAAAALMPLGGL